MIRKRRPTFRTRFYFLLCLLCPLLFCQNTLAQVEAKNYLDLVTRAETQVQAKQWRNAAKVLEEIVRQNPVDGRFWHHLGTSYYNVKDYRQAVLAFRKSYELGFDNPANTAYNIACNYALLSEKDSALRWLEKAFSLGFSDLKQAQTERPIASLFEKRRRKLLV